MVKLAQERHIQWYELNLFNTLFMSCLATLLSSCFSTRADLAYHQNQIGESTIGHFMIFSISPRVGEAPLFMKLEFKWLKFITNKFVIYYQAMVLKRDILFFCLLYIARLTTIVGLLCTGLSFLLLVTLLYIYN